MPLPSQVDLKLGLALPQISNFHPMRDVERKRERSGQSDQGDRQLSHMTTNGGVEVEIPHLVHPMSKRSLRGEFQYVVSKATTHCFRGPWTCHSIHLRTSHIAPRLVVMICTIHPRPILNPREAVSNCLPVSLPVYACPLPTEQD